MTTSEFDALAALLNRRYSCRAFQPQPLPRELIVRILDTAQRTASWCNSQAWRLHIASGDSIERLRTAMTEAATTQAATPDIPWPREYRGVYLQRRRECGFGLYNSLGIAKGDRAASAAQELENFRFFGAPHVAIISSDEALGSYGAVDCGAYVSTFLLAAAGVGVATIAQAALSMYPAVLREQLGIGDDRTIVCGISFGRADETHPANRFRTARAAALDNVTFLD